MKQILFFVILFFNLVPDLNEGELCIHGPQASYAFGGEYDGEDGGEDDDWEEDPDDDQDWYDPNDPENPYQPSNGTKVIPHDQINSFIVWLKSEYGAVPTPSFACSFLAGGVLHHGTAFEVWQMRDGEPTHVATYFSPYGNSDQMSTGNYYSIGNGVNGDPVIEDPEDNPGSNNGTDFEDPYNFDGSAGDPGNYPDDPDDQDPGSGGNGVTNPNLPQVAIFLIHRLNVTTSQTALMTYLTEIASLDELNIIRDYIIANGNTSREIEFAKWAIEFLYNNPTFDVNMFFAADEYTGVNTPPTSLNEEPLIISDIQIGEVDANSPQNQNRVIGGMPNRHGPTNTAPDMQHGFNGDTNGIIPGELNQTDAHLFAQMRNLVWLTSLISEEMRTVTSLMVDKFQAKTGGEFTNPILTEKVKNSITFKNFLINFGKEMEKELKKVGGDINQVSALNTENYRPIFNSTYNKFSGLQIALNDTESNEIRLLNFTTTGGAYWSASVEVTLTDNFGLDINDARVYQGKHSGFAAWYILQHKRGYVPFVTKIVIKSSIGGRL
jgi:hypothetical protein